MFTFFLYLILFCIVTKVLQARPGELVVTYPYLDREIGSSHIFDKFSHIWTNPVILKNI